MAKYPISLQTLERLDSAFAHHPSSDEQLVRFASIRMHARDLALIIAGNTPPSPEQGEALTHLEQAVFFAIAAIARNEKVAPDQQLSWIGEREVAAEIEGREVPVRDGGAEGPVIGTASMAGDGTARVTITDAAAAEQINAGARGGRGPVSVGYTVGAEPCNERHCISTVPIVAYSQCVRTGPHMGHQDAAGRRWNTPPAQSERTP